MVLMCIKYARHYLLLANTLCFFILFARHTTDRQKVRIEKLQMALNASAPFLSEDKEKRRNATNMIMKIPLTILSG